MTSEQRTSRELRKHLRDLVTSTTSFLKHLDIEMRQPSTPERGSHIAKLSNFLEMAKDRARHFGLGEKL